MAMQLRPGEQWRFEVDVKTLEHYRHLAGLTVLQLAAAAHIGPGTYVVLKRDGTCNMHVLARLATYYKVQPGELVIWYPVPEGTPDKWPYRLRGTGKRIPSRANRQRRRGKKWREPEIEKMLRLYAAGVTTKVLAGILGRSQMAVRERLLQLRKEGAIR